MSFKPILIKLLRRLVTQSLMRPNLFINSIPGLESSLKPARIGREVFHLIEFFLVGAAGTLYPLIALRIVRPVEIMEQI